MPKDSMNEVPSTSTIFPNPIKAPLAQQRIEDEEENLQSSMAKNQNRKVEGDQHQAATRKTRTTNSAAAQLCQECAKIDLDKIMNIDLEDLRTKGEEGIWIADLGTRINFAPRNKCRLCQFFHENRQPSEPFEELYQLRAFPHYMENRLLNSINHYQIAQFTNIPYLGIIPTNLYYPLSEGTHPFFDSKGWLRQRGTVFCVSNARDTGTVFQTRIIPKSLDFRLAKEWINHCVDNHAGCSVHGEQLDRLQLIDCLRENENPLEIKEPVEAPKNAIYAALSYVWGGPSGEKIYTQTVSDAIIATRQLGLQYLWVDKHCIPEDKKEKERQIRKMDLIYKRAHITIIASAGADANHGLPGVGNTPKDDQLVVSIGKFSFVNSMTHLHKSIIESKWATRGWTLQESFLSHRRLVFTQNQLYFECGRMNCSEALPPHDFETMEKLKLRQNSGVYAGLSVYTDDSKVTQYRQVAAEYSGRELTNIGDALDAFAGVFHNSCSNGVKQLWGIGYENCGNDDPSMMIASFTISLAWYHVDDSLPKRCHTFTMERGALDSPSTAENAESIPSWSWLGWYEPTQPDRVAARVKYENRAAMNSTDCDVEDVVLEFSNTPGTVSLKNPQEWPPCLGRLGEADSFSKPVALLLKGGILKPGSLQYDSDGSEGLRYGLKSAPRTILFNGRKIVWHLSSWPGSSSVEKCRMKRLYDSIKAGSIELFLLERQDKHYHVFLVTRKNYNKGNSDRIGTASIVCYDLYKCNQIKKGITIRLL